MKFSLIIAFLLLVSVTFERRIRRHRHTRRSHHRGPAVAPLGKGGIIYQFALGFLVELNGNAEWIDKCSQVIPGWETAATLEESKKTVEADTEPTQTTFQKIMGYVGKGIDFLCGYKDDIKAWIIKQLGRYIRRFLQGKTTTRFKWAGDALFNAVKEKARAFGEKVLEGTALYGDTIIKGVNFLCKTIDDLQNFIKEQINTILQPIYDEFEKIKAAFTKFLKENPILKAIWDLANCLYTNKDVIAEGGTKGFIEPLQNFQKRIASLDTKAGWVGFIVDAICGYQDLIDAIKFLQDGRAATDANLKYNNYGKFFGKLINALQLEEEESK